MKRREAISLVGLGLGLVPGVGTVVNAAGWATGTGVPTVFNGRKRVIVIGAGAAGLAAAKRLSQESVDVLVLEARDRIGGRIFSNRKWSGPGMDLGASWIHGAGPANPIAKLARQLGSRLAATDTERGDVFVGGGKLSPSDSQRLEAVRKEIRAALSERSPLDRDRGLKALISDELDYAQRSSLEQRFIDFVINTSFEHEYGGASEKLSAKWFDSGEGFEGDELVFLDGYEVVPQHLAQGLHIKLNHEVTAISYQESQGVTVQTTQGPFAADQVIVTLPLGVLKASKVRFSPELPAQKQAAIEGLGVGLLNKCCLLFPRRFWDKEIDWLNRIPHAGMQGQWAEWVSFSRLTNQPVLMGFNAADFGRTIEGWDDTSIARNAMEALRGMFGEGIPAPIDVLTTRWGKDPFAYGAYSCHVVGSQPDMRDHLAQSIGNYLFFAGEATERQYYQTVHGAYQSGLRAAAQALLHQKTNGQA